MNEIKNQTFHLFLCLIGILCSFSVYGVIQERIMTVPFGEEKERFTNPSFLIFVNRIIAFSLSLFLSPVVSKGRKEIQSIYPSLLINYAFVAGSNFIATYCQYKALEFIDFPLTTLIKTGRIVPVMIIGWIFLNKKYGLSDYLATVLITSGCISFTLNDSNYRIQTMETNENKNENYLIGSLLVFGFLCFDATTSAIQEHLFNGKEGINLEKLDHLFWTNITATVLSFPLILITGKLSSGVFFLIRHPSLFFLSISLSICSAFGQFCITTLISDFGALVFATIMVTRHIFSITISCFLFDHPINLIQILSAATVFFVVFFRGYLSSKKSHH